MERCWQQGPDFRPSFEFLRQKLVTYIEKKVTFFDNLIHCLPFMVSRIYILFVATLFVLNFAGTLFSDFGEKLFRAVLFSRSQ